MALPGIRVQIFHLARRADVQKVLVMQLIIATGKPLDFLHVLVVGDAVAVGALDQIAAGAVEDHADFAALGALKQAVQLLIRRIIDRQSAGFEDHAFVPIVVDRDLRVGRVSRIDVAVILAFGLVTQAPAVREDADRMRTDAQPPAGDIGLMRPLVAGIAVAVVALPVPVVVELGSSHIGSGVRGRTAPEIEVDLVRNRVIAQRSNRLAALVAQAARELHLADPPVGNEFDRVDDGRIGPALGPRLADSPILFRGGDQRRTFRNVVTDRFL